MDENRTGPLNAILGWAALNSRFQMHIPKPVDAADLARAVQELVDGDLRQAA
ncbi:MAG: hypothetical protein ABI539_05885 [Acidobacteriota bacterium]